MGQKTGFSQHVNANAPRALDARTMMDDRRAALVSSVLFRMRLLWGSYSRTHTVPLLADSQPNLPLFRNHRHRASARTGASHRHCANWRC